MLSFAEYQLQFIGRCEGDGLRFDKSARGPVPHIRCFEEKKKGNWGEKNKTLRNGNRDKEWKERNPQTHCETEEQKTQTFFVIFQCAKKYTIEESTNIHKKSLLGNQ